MDKFRNKNRIQTTRAAFWNYANEGSYYITICAANRECIFGRIIDKTMVLSSVGEIVIQEWNKSFEIRSELFCDAFVLMPNHLHAIVRIVETHGTYVVETHGRASLHGRAHKLKLHPIGIAYRAPKSVSSFVAGFKSSATKRINEFRNTPKLSVWQSGFHDRIIRNNAEFQFISDYIKNNPANWENKDI